MIANTYSAGLNSNLTGFPEFLFVQDHLQYNFHNVI